MNLRKTMGLAALGLSLMYAGTAFAESYLVIAKGNKISSKQLASIEKAGGVIRHVMSPVGMALVDSDTADFQDIVGNINGIHSVPRDISQRFVSPVDGEAISFQAASIEAVNPPITGDDDFFFDLQWGHTAINATDAWEKGHRGAGVRVAVLDSGIDVNHPDLAPNLNLFLSQTFVNEPLDSAIAAPGDTFNHGTHTAGTIGAADNGFGTIGVAPEVELVAVKVLYHSGSGPFGSIFAGMVYAAEIGADVVNMSLGASIPRNCTFYDEALDEFVHYPAWECSALWTAGNRVANYMRKMGTLVIASAGNDGRDLNKDASLKEFPNDLPGVVPVSATAPIGWLPYWPNSNLDYLASYSNYGTSSVQFSAPGGDYVYPGEELCGLVVVRPCWLFDFVFSTGTGGWYWSVGTSMAAPHATGVAALIIGANGGSGSMSPAQVIAAMKAGADDLGKPGKDSAYGHGRVNAANSVP